MVYNIVGQRTTFYETEKNMNISEFINGITSGAFDSSFRLLYGSSVSGSLRHRARYISAAEHFSRLYPLCSELRIFSVPGDMNIIGGSLHGGVSLSAAAGSDMVAFASTNEDGAIRVASDSGEEAELSVDKLEIAEKEQGTFIALVKTIAAEFPLINGISCYIFPAVTEENRGAVALLLASVLNAFSNSRKTAAELAVIAAKAARSEVEEPLVRALGGFVLTDCADHGTDCIPFDMENGGYTLCVSEVVGSIPVASDRSPIEFADEEELYAEIPELKKSLTDEEILSAMYFLGENRRAVQAADALKNGDTEEFFAVINEAPEISMSHKTTLAYTAGRRLLSGCGALKINREGRLLAFVPNYRAEDFTMEMNRIFGESFCRTMKLRSVGIYELKI